jgi:hypothetical protein
VQTYNVLIQIAMCTPTTQQKWTKVSIVLVCLNWIWFYLKCNNNNNNFKFSRLAADLGVVIHDIIRLIM